MTQDCIDYTYSVLKHVFVFFFIFQQYQIYSKKNNRFAAYYCIIIVRIDH